MHLLTDFTHPTYLPLDTIAFRLVLAALLGAMIGIEREWRKRPAGLRTHMVTALAAAVFTILTIEILYSPMLEQRESQADPVRVIEAVTAGVAFLAAGAIIQGRANVQGLTTGAGMWLAGALGVSAGLGYPTLAILAGILGVIIIAVLGKLAAAIEKAGPSDAGKSEARPD